VSVAETAEVPEPVGFEATDELGPDVLARRRGRPRDASVDARILTEARAVYAERGWAGFNFDVVAQQAKVSKDAMYRRYSTKQDLLLAALERWIVPRPPNPPVDDIREYLVAFAEAYFETYAAASGMASLRIFVEAPQNPELLEAYHRETSAPAVVQVKGVVRRAMGAGQLPAARSPTPIIDAILGGVVMHVLATPPEHRRRMVAGAPTYLRELVDLVLRGCGYAVGER
jgi:AcrR family transcriptional regulator